MVRFLTSLLFLGLTSLVLVSPDWAEQLRSIKVVAKTPDGQTRQLPLYSSYYALVVGCGEYNNGWPQLPNPVSDAREVANTLTDMGWRVEIVENPTGAQLRGALYELVTGPGRDKESAILVWFSGHGHTLSEVDGSKLGYIVPIDAPNPDNNEMGFMERGVSMRQIETIARRIYSKHVLMIFDSCFSGAIFQMVRSRPSPYIEEKVSSPVREFITAGSEYEQVPDKSVFKVCFLQGIKDGFADINSDGYVTGEELGIYLQEQVVNYTRKAQHPQFGKINHPRLDKGDFVFVLDAAKAGLAKQSKSRERTDAWAYIPQTQPRPEQKDYFQAPHRPKTQTPKDRYSQAEILFDQEEYDQVISLLSGYCAINRTDLRANVLLAKAYLEKCSRFKQEGNETWRTLVYAPYKMSKAMYAYRKDPKIYDFNRYLPDILYIAAKSFHLNDRSSRARKYILKAMNLTETPRVEFLFLLADINFQEAINDRSKEDYLAAKETYEEIIKVAESNDDSALAYYQLGLLFDKYSTKAEATESMNTALTLAQKPSLTLKIQSTMEAKNWTGEMQEHKLASISKTVGKLSLRKESKTLMDYQVKEICRRYDFYESSWNPGGSFNNDYLDNRDGTLTDGTTGLMWQKSGSHISLSRRKANYYIKKLNSEQFGGYTDWRLPTTEEIASLLERRQINDLHIDPMFDEKQISCWCSDKGVPFGGYTNNPPQAWHVNFREGVMGLTILPTRSGKDHAYTQHYVRAVRSLR
jgi:tetratricopeptide (TPR) repeat protein